MPVSTQKLIARYFLLAIGGGSLLLYVISATNEFRAQRCAASGNFDCAIAVQPTNSDYYISRARQHRFGSGNYNLAITDLKKALSLNPNNADAWMDLADAQFGSGDIEGVAESVKRALRADFTTPSIHWRAATYLLAAGNTPQAKSQMRLAVAMNRYLSEEAVRVAWSLNRNEADVFEVLPETQYSYAEALHFFISNDNLQGARETWKRILATGALIEPHQRAPEDSGEFNWRHARAFIDYLLYKREYSEAKEVWSAACKATFRAAQCDQTNYVVNGSFEDPVDAPGAMTGFDWRARVPSILRDSTNSFDGEYSLKIDFNPEMQDQTPLMQWLRMPPSSNLTFKAMYKPEFAATLGKLNFVVEDANGKTLGQGEISTERSDWKEIVFRFDTPAWTDGARLRLTSSGPTKGTLWIDRVELERTK